MGKYFLSVAAKNRRNSAGKYFLTGAETAIQGRKYFFELFSLRLSEKKFFILWYKNGGDRMGNYGGIQLPTITGGTMDSEKERRQILNYLALLDEKLRYMFQNIDIEENLS